MIASLDQKTTFRTMDSMPDDISIIIASRASDHITTLDEHIRSHFHFTVDRADSLTSLNHHLKKSTPDILIIDPNATSEGFTIELIKKLQKKLPSLLILPLIPENRRQLFEQLSSLNLFLYIHTPIEPAETTLVIIRAAEYLELHRKRLTDKQSLPRHQKFHGMIGSSKPMLTLFDLITRVAADDDSTVLILGESGTGKEMVAKAIHTQSHRNAHNFVPVNCAAIPEDLLESELFGYAKGAFTGASSNKIGRIQYADGGTLFLDEIGDMKPTLQAKLLRVLQEKEFEPVGSLKSIPVDTRILAATHCDLEQLVSDGKFREDLYYRLSVIPLTIPPLRKRREDIPALIEYFIHHYTTQRDREPFTFASRAFKALFHFDWRGNVRELENLIQHMSILYAGKKVGFDDLPEKFMTMLDIIEKEQPPSPPPAKTEENGNGHYLVNPKYVSDIPWHKGQVDFRELINSFETELILHAMRISAGNKKEAARLLNLKRTTLLEKIKKKDLGDSWKTKSTKTNRTKTDRTEDENR